MKFSCNICYSNPGNCILTCYCLLCKQCIKEKLVKGLNTAKIKPDTKILCLVCNKPILIQKTLDLTKQENLNKYSFIFQDPEKLMNQTFECIKVFIINTVPKKLSNEIH